jgi:uncharacterized protein with GYD domain
MDFLVLIVTSPAAAHRVAHSIWGLESPYVKEVFITLGVYDVAMLVHIDGANELGEMSHFVVQKIQAIEGVVQTMTLPAIKHE